MPLGNEFANGLVRGMGQAAGSAWYTSTYLYVIIAIVLLYYLHANPPEMFMRRLTAESIGYSSFVGEWHNGAEDDTKKTRTIEFAPDAKTVTKDGNQYDMEDALIYSVIGAPKLRFDAELADGKLSHVFVTAHEKYISVSIDGGKSMTYWKDKRRV